MLVMRVQLWIAVVCVAQRRREEEKDKIRRHDSSEARTAKTFEVAAHTPSNRHSA